MGFVAFFINIGVYIFCYKTVVKRNFRISLQDYDDWDEYVQDLAKSYGITTLTQGIISICGYPPQIEDYESVPDWVSALHEYFKTVKNL